MLPGISVCCAAGINFRIRAAIISELRPGVMNSCQSICREWAEREEI